MDAGIQTGPRPISRRQFRRGGKVAGEAGPKRADRKPRASGGRALTADSLINRNVKEANEERDGLKHIGGMKSGGRAHKDMGGLAGDVLAPAKQGVYARQVADRANLRQQAAAARNNLQQQAAAYRASMREPKVGDRPGKFYGGAMSPQQRMGLQQRPVAAAPVAPMRPSVRPMMRAEGGKVHKDEAQDRELIHKMGCKCGKCSGGRVGRREGGRTEFEANQSLTQTAKMPAKSAQDFRVMRDASKPGGDPYNSAITRPARKEGGKVRAAINDGTRPVAGRLARKGGGRTKKGTNVNIVIAPQSAPQRPPMPPPGMAGPPPGAPVGLHQGAPPPPAGAPPGVMPPGAPMPRASGGRTNDGWSGQLAKPGKYPIDAGAGGGLGRLEKAKAARP
jgi:hypothetical protein